jgi:hypothetical protein
VANQRGESSKNIMLQLDVAASQSAALLERISLVAVMLKVLPRVAEAS